MPDERPCTSELLRRRVDAFDQRIEKWEPDTPWDAANQRSLRYCKKYRTAAMKALLRQENKEKELAIENRRKSQIPIDKIPQ